MVTSFKTFINCLNIYQFLFHAYNAISLSFVVLNVRKELILFAYLQYFFYDIIFQVDNYVKEKRLGCNLKFQSAQSIKP